MKGTLDLLYLRLLLRRLDATDHSELHGLIIGEARDAAELAGATTFPGLVFPCLFEERAAAVLELQAQKADHYWSALDKLATRRRAAPNDASAGSDGNCDVGSNAAIHTASNAAPDVISTGLENLGLSQNCNNSDTVLSHSCTKVRSQKLFTSPETKP